MADDLATTKGTSTANLSERRKEAAPTTANSSSRGADVSSGLTANQRQALRKSDMDDALCMQQPAARCKEDLLRHFLPPRLLPKLAVAARAGPGCETEDG